MRIASHANPNAPGNALFSRGVAIAAFASLFLATVAWYAGPELGRVMVSLLTDGAIAVMWIIAAVAMGSIVLRVCRVPLEGPLGFASAAGVGLGLFSLAGLALGLCGMLNRASAIALPVIGVLAWCAMNLSLLTIDSHVVKNWLKANAGVAWIFVLLAPLAGMTAIGGTILPGVLWKPDDPHPYDVTVYHLQVPREWFEIGRIVPLHHNVYSYFPFNMEMHYLLGMHAMGGPWEAMYFCQYLSGLLGALTVIAVYGGALRAGSSRAGAALAATLVGAVPWLTMVGSTAYVENALIFYGALSLAWMLRALSPSPGTPGEGGGEGLRFFISGVFAGFAAGVKFTAVPMLIVALVVALLIVKRNLKGAAIFVLAAMLTLSPWLIRNAVWTGNPVFPLALNTLGHGHFDNQQVLRFEAAHTAPEIQKSFPQRIIAFVKQVPADMHFGYVLLPIALIVTAMRWRDREVWVLLVMLLQMLLVWLFFTHLIGRFYVLAIPVAALLVARINWNRWATLAISVAAIGISIWRIDVEFRPFVEQGRAGAFYVKDLSFMVADDLAAAEKTGATIVLVGDSQAFLHQIPMKQLRYRTVFDLAEGDWLSAWTSGTPDDAILVAHPPELKRLSDTYLGVKPMPADLAAGHDRAFILPREAAAR